jgi:hypothetical protein
MKEKSPWRPLVSIGVTGNPRIFRNEVSEDANAGGTDEQGKV